MRETGGFPAKRILHISPQLIPAPTKKLKSGSHIVVFDIETEAIQPGEIPKPKIACAYSSKTKRYRFFRPTQFLELLRHLNKAEAVVSFNGENFDIKVIAQQLRRKQGAIAFKRSIDLFQIAREATGRAHSLNNLVYLNLGEPKKAFGHNIPSNQMSDIADACRSDVSQTLKLYRLYEKGRLKAPAIPLTKRDYSAMPFGGRCPICNDLASINELMPDYEGLSERDEARYMLGEIATARCFTCGTIFGRDGEESAIQLTQSIDAIRALRGEPDWPDSAKFPST